jgi:hypothetical protein
MFGVNPWKLMLWMGHKRIDETMLYVHFAESHMRPLRRRSSRRGAETTTRIGRVIAMMSARQNALMSDPHCSKPGSARESA